MAGLSGCDDKLITHGLITNIFSNIFTSTKYDRTKSSLSFILSILSKSFSTFGNMNSSDNQQNNSNPSTGSTPDERLQNQQVTAIQNLVVVASRSDSWIFNTITREWHSPEEFKAKYLSKPYEQGWYHRFKVLPPIDGITAADKQMQRILEKKQDLVRRVIEYYQNRA